MSLRFCSGQVLLWSWMVAASGIARGDITLIDTTYSEPKLPRLAPGEVVTLALSGLRSRFPQPLRNSSSPLSATLGGIEIALRQFSGVEIPVPLLSITETPCIDGASPQCGVVTLISVQIPFELAVPPPGSLAPVTAVALTISEQGIRQAPVHILPTHDAVHIVSTCDTTSANVPGPCRAGLVHADGTPVSTASPAASGETLSMFAFGLGRTIPTLASGAVTSVTAQVPDPIAVRFSYGANLGGGRDLPGQASVLFAGLAAGFVGLYQVNFQVPLAPELLPACGPQVQSNLTLSLVGFSSFDSVGICVTP